MLIRVLSSITPIALKVGNKEYRPVAQLASKKCSLFSVPLPSSSSFNSPWSKIFTDLRQINTTYNDILGLFPLQSQLLQRTGNDNQLVISPPLLYRVNTSIPSLLRCVHPQFKTIAQFPRSTDPIKKIRLSSLDYFGCLIWGELHLAKAVTSLR